MDTKDRNQDGLKSVILFQKLYYLRDVTMTCCIEKQPFSFIDKENCNKCCTFFIRRR